MKCKKIISAKNVKQFTNKTLKEQEELIQQLLKILQRFKKGYQLIEFQKDKELISYLQKNPKMIKKYQNYQQLDDQQKQCVIEYIFSRKNNWLAYVQMVCNIYDQNVINEIEQKTCFIFGNIKYAKRDFFLHIPLSSIAKLRGIIKKNKVIDIKQL